MKKNDGENRMKKIFPYKEKICELQNHDRKAIAKIRKMCTDKVQKQFIYIKALKKWTPKKL